jgi:hypothetical protein
MDFFAKFGTREPIRVQKARAHYLVGLGHLGKGEKDRARESFEAAVQLCASHLGARTMLALVR